MRTLLNAILLVMLYASRTLATAQGTDFIFYEGTKYPLQTNPMDAYFSAHPDKKPASEIRITALWRGYIATFEVKDEMLLLDDIGVLTATKTPEGKSEYGLKSVKSQVVPEGQVMQVDWFTGILVIPTGQLAEYVHMGYASSYSNYILLEVTAGRITDERKLDLEQYKHFKERQFQAYRRTDAYKKQVAELQRNGESPESIDAFLRISVIEYSTEFLDEDAPATQVTKDQLQ